MIVDFRTKSEHCKLNINGADVERVNVYKYLGVLIDNKFTFHEHSTSVYKKALHKLFYLRKLHSVKVNNTILSLFYRSIVQSTLLYCMCVWFGNCTIAQRRKLDRIVKTALKLGVKDCRYTEYLYNESLFKKATKIMCDPTHQLHDCFLVMRSSKRLRNTKIRTARYII